MAGVRSSSTDSTASSAPRPTARRKGSSGSSKDGSELDDFLKERLAPVVLRGSGSTYSATASTAETQPTGVPDPSSSSSLDSYPKPQLLPSAMRGNRGTSPAKRPHLRGPMPSDSSEDDVTARYPTLAARRSLNRLSQMDNKSAVRMPAPINTSFPLQAQSADSYDAETSALPQADSTFPALDEQTDGREGFWLRPQQPETTAKSSRKWNFFQRAHASPRPKGKGKVLPNDEFSEASAHQSPYRSVAHYAMMDPVESVDLYEVERIVQENETSADDSTSDLQPPSRLVPYERRHGGLLPSPTKAGMATDSDFRAKPTLPRIVVRQDSSESPELMRAQSAIPQQLPQIVDIPRSPARVQRNASTAPQHSTPEVPHVFSTPELSQAPLGTPERLGESDSPRQPRLSPVGRIPMVVSRRDRDRKLPDNSFSRPFARTQPHPSVKPPGTLYNQIRSSRELTSPIDAGSQPVSSTSTRSDGASAEPKSSTYTNPPSVSTNRTSMDMRASNEVFAFSPRKNSDVSYTNSSSTASWMAALAAQPQQDDPWAEYNDLLDDMMPQKTPISAGSSLGAPFQYANVLYGTSSPSMPTPLNLSIPPSMELPPPPRSRTVPAVLSVPQQVARFMQPSMSPLTPHTTISDLIGHYGDSGTTVNTPTRTSFPPPQCSSILQPNRASLPNARASMTSSRYSRASGHSRSASLPEANARNSQSSLSPSACLNRDTQLLDIAEDDGDRQAYKANLRFGALLTSKWLSFGRVLVSPAHNEMRLSDQPKVLVVDGLGSDWSYYVALSYPSASVYSLGPAAINGSTSWSDVHQKPPTNHRHIPHSGISAAFPFPKGFFTAVVFRFPIATTEPAYHACIFECKRVLKPGGHLEVAVLDLDLINMGARARSLVRGLKTRMQQHDQSVSLRDMSDVLVRLIGKRGFEQIQRCVVGVPAVGRIPGSQDMSSISSSNSNKTPTTRRHSRRNVEKKISFADLLEGARNSQVEPSRGNDEGITKMVAKVGRWWYSTCYETPLLETGGSIWDDHALLRECEKQGTSFRLLICYAQKPTQTQRRTVSV
ncbi:hypothetical protein LTR36_001440 [Oleoguttula mirabilis]|uniref:Methyltransferase type 11 domain-containing protein n=1 Tax=Oleoguttula mirabilis TaxID=1507867 RepID=A0AAV9JNV6_9PEZI|nr:hypothetical protein LTR36_001440 [Oleoguttula mirabilis]